MVEVSGKEPAIVFLHGLGGTHRYWQSVMDDVTCQSHLIFMDLLGFGDSPRPYRRYTIDLHVAELKKALGDRKNLTLVGHSLGSALAMAFAARYPELVNRLVLISFPYFGSKHKAYRWLRRTPSGWLLTNMLVTALVCLVTRALAKRILPLFLRDYPVEVVEDLVKHNIMSSVSSLWDVLYRYDLAREAEKITTALPVIFIHAEDDITAPVIEIKKLVKRYAGWKLYLINGTGHQPWLKATKTCLDIILGVPIMTHNDFFSEFEA